MHVYTSIQISEHMDISQGSNYVHDNKSTLKQQIEVYFKRTHLSIDKNPTKTRKNICPT